MRFLFIFFALWTTSVYADFNSIIDATCSVNRGTGVIYKQNDTHFWVITAAHCVLDKNDKLEPIYVYFYHAGRRSHRISGELEWHIFEKHTTTDLAMIMVKKSDLKSYPHPKPIPFASRDTRILTDMVIISCGCARAKWPTAFRGHVFRSGQEDRFWIRPKPLPGRSGSGVFDKDGTHILGILVFGDGSAISLAKIYELAGKKD